MFDLEDKVQAVYTSIELNEAVKMGYKITKVYKALKFERDNNIFKSYVGNLLQKKVEATGSDHHMMMICVYFWKSTRKDLILIFRKKI